MRMNKICTMAVMLICIMVLSCLSVAASAGETNLAETGDQDVDVYAKTIYNWPENCYTAEEKDGCYTVETADGTIITVTPGESDASLRLVVYQIVSDDSEAYTWIMDCTDGIGDERWPYEIYFIDESGNRVEIGNASVSITLSDGCGEYFAYQVKSDGTVSRMSSSMGDGAINFTVSTNGFYVLVSSTEEADTTGTGDNGSDDQTVVGDTGSADGDESTAEAGGGEAISTDSSGNTDNVNNTDGLDDATDSGQVRTGDDTSVAMWSAILFLSAMLAIFLLKYGRKTE
ncbi:MAG: hypothetical protein LUE29_14150 [Lachnospiraceae bacterium]|nr:hypothetical protein [Lachnospiraceae bacterium]